MKPYLSDPDSHRWRRLTIADEWYGRMCKCGRLKSDQAVRCRACYFEQRREHGVCGDCGGPTSQACYRRCRLCANKLLIGNKFAVGRSQPKSHPWRKPIVREAA